jgi:hypothetical protein
MDYRLRNSFEDQRRRLQESPGIKQIDRPLAYWALPADRRLPLALLGRTVGELLAMPYQEIAATPGIGHKKLAMLITLLDRVAASAAEKNSLVSRDVSDPSCDAVSIASCLPGLSTSGLETTGTGIDAAGFNSTAALTKEGVPASVTESSDADPVLTTTTSSPLSEAAVQFDVSRVSETQWDRWRETVRTHQLENEPLGRVCASLRHLPTVIWRTPLSTYLPLSLAEIRSLRTYGEKRVRAVIRVFWEIDQALGRIPRQSAFAVRLVPYNLEQVDTWLRERLLGHGVVTPTEIRQNLTLPILNQIQLDAGEPIAGLAERRLAVETPAFSVRQESERLGVTRARIYQLLDTCGAIMSVRWPAGRWALQGLIDHVRTRQDDVDLTEIVTLCNLCYPEPEVTQVDDRQAGNSSENATGPDVSQEDELLADFPQSDSK